MGNEDDVNISARDGGKIPPRTNCAASRLIPATNKRLLDELLQLKETHFSSVALQTDFNLFLVMIVRVRLMKPVVWKEGSTIVVRIEHRIVSSTAPAYTPRHRRLLPLQTVD